ncbi:MAG: hypothetical protein KKB30_14475 [Proteobacteria bacterium]|nr:hypothetical protein [Pseudomonadota bacterium]MBU1715568.1 hypothetical protein [Pseudomonadota bacterium]
MECKRLTKLVKDWYMHVQDETLAPARMVAFMKKHIAECETCLLDVVVISEVERITAIVLPPSKIPKAVKKAAEDRIIDDEDDEVEDDEVEDEVDDEEEEEEEDEDDEI